MKNRGIIEGRYVPVALLLLAALLSGGGCATTSGEVSIEAKAAVALRAGNIAYEEATRTAGELNRAKLAAARKDFADGVIPQGDLDAAEAAAVKNREDVLKVARPVEAALNTLKATLEVYLSAKSSDPAALQSAMDSVSAALASLGKLKETEE